MLKFSKNIRFYLICFFIITCILVLCYNLFNLYNIESFKTNGTSYNCSHCSQCSPITNTSDPNTSDPNTSDPNTSDPNTSDPNTSDSNTLNFSSKTGTTKPVSKPPPKSKPSSSEPKAACWLVPMSTDPGNATPTPVPTGTWKQKTQTLIDYQNGKGFPFNYAEYKCWAPGQIAPFSNETMGPAVKGSKPQGTCSLAIGPGGVPPSDNCWDYNISYACSGPSGSVRGTEQANPRYMTGSDLQKLSGPQDSTCIAVTAGSTYNDKTKTGRPDLIKWLNDPSCGGFCKPQK